MATWELPMVRDERYVTWQSDEEVCTQHPEPLRAAALVLPEEAADRL